MLANQSTTKSGKKVKISPAKFGIEDSYEDMVYYSPAARNSIKLRRQSTLAVLAQATTPSLLPNDCDSKRSASSRTYPNPDRLSAGRNRAGSCSCSDMILW